MKITSKKYTHLGESICTLKDVEKVAHNCLNYGERKFTLTSMSPDDLNKEILQIMHKETMKPNHGKGVALVINVYDGNQNCDENSSIKSTFLRNRNPALKLRCALSPQPRETYFCINKLDFNKIQPENHQNLSNFKNIKRVMNSHPSQDPQSKLSFKDIVRRRANSPKIRNQVLASMMKKYTYKFLKNPFLIANENIATDENSMINTSKFNSNQLEPKKLDCKETALNSKIVFESPFYKKRHQLKSTFRRFSRFISDRDAEFLGKRIWRQAHHNLNNEVSA